MELYIFFCCFRYHHCRLSYQIDSQLDTDEIYKKNVKTIVFWLQKWQLAIISTDIGLALYKR